LPQTDDCKSSSILPSAELNPLVNPLLGQHLGRWAEVYFTAAPDKREDAVRELLLQLQAEDPDDKDPSEGSAPHREMAASENQSPEKRAPAPGSLADLAGKIISAENSESEAAEPTVAFAVEPDLDFLPEPLRDPPPEQSNLGGLGDSGALPPRPIPALEAVMPVPEDPALLRSLLAAPTQPARLRSALRLPASSVIATLALVALATGYFIGRSRPADVATAPSLPRIATQGGPPSSVPVAIPSGPTNPDRAPVPQTTSSVKMPPGAQSSSPVLPEAEKNADSANAAVSAAALRGVITEQANGSQELNLARSYLSGSDGKPPDSVEAAKWLWKAVAKQNVEASDLLSTLYLSGNGVPKNCDQARLLLDAAARKGRSQAAERLTHLQAFGCQ